MIKYSFLILFLLPFTALAQISITGKVLSASDKKPVASASVFLSNALVGGKTNDDGMFTLNGVRSGQYELVVTVVGYETYRRMVQINNASIILPAIELAVKTTELNVVNIRPDPEWGKRYATFKREFLGTSEIAKQCKILNPEMLDLEYNAAGRKLTATSYDFLEIENKALGYRIKYLLTNFLKDGKTNLIYFEGSAFFENMKGSKSDLKRWQKKRNEVYTGSSMHFLRSVLASSVSENGFEVLRLVRTPNPAYNGFNYRYFQTLVNKPLEMADYIKLTDQKGLFAMKYADCLYVEHYKKPRKEKGKGESIELDKPAGPATIIAFAEPYALFDNNGIITNPASLVFEGAWGTSRMAEMLPVDFEPTIKLRH
jgi:hypothetical protein